jgi:hypothetical protein
LCPVSLENEILALQRLVKIVCSSPAALNHTTSLEGDELELQNLSESHNLSDSEENLIAALSYRITRKRIIFNTVVQLNLLREWIESLENKRAAFGDYMVRKDVYICLLFIYCLLWVY